MVAWERGSKQMRILQVTPYFCEHYGGTERYCFNLSRELIKLGHEVHVYTSHIESDAPRIETRAGIKIHRFPTIMNIWNINPLSIITHRMVQSNFDIIHVHSYIYFNSNQAVLAKIIRTYLRKKTKLILHLHGGLGTPPYLDKQPIKKTIKRFYDKTVGKVMMKGADRILSACQSDAKIAQKQFNIPNGKISIIYNAIDMNLFNNSSNRLESNIEPYLLFVGDLESWKGLQPLITSMKILERNGEKFKLRIIGTGSLEEQLRGMADGLDIDFLGFVPHYQIPDMMKSAFAFILPSYWEGIPTVALEAISSGTPVIATDVGGIPEIIRNDKTGILIKPNAPLEIANAVQRLKDERLRKTIIENGLNLIKNQFTIQPVAKQTEKIYKQVLLPAYH